MNKFIVIKFAELFLKGKNRFQFINCLIKNIKNVFCEFNIEIKKMLNFLVLSFNNFENENLILNQLSFIPGISQFHIVYCCEANFDLIFNIIDSKLNLNKCKSFKIEIKRRNKNIFSREEIIQNVAKHVIEKYNLIVDIKNPDVIINIEINSSKDVFVWTQKFSGLGGLPIGINGQCLSLLSGGIDSPVASYLIQKKGQIVDYITFITNEVTNKTVDKLQKLINKITLDNKLHKAKLYIVDFTKIQQELSHISQEKYRITLMRRSFYRIAEKIAIKNNYKALVCGDSLGQVASQTIESINTISNACKNIQIFRPLLTFDKLEIINIANKIQTYNISILDHEDICSLFAPSNPVTKPNIKIAISLENELKYLNYLEDSAVEKIKVI